MAVYYKISAQRLTGIADAIREKKKTTDLLTPEQMVAEIRGIESGSPSAAEVTFGYVKKTETVTEQAPNGKRFYNGVLLPEIPADVLASFQYCWINSTADGLVVAAYPWYYASAKMNIPTSSENRKYVLNADGTGWTLNNTYTDTGGYSVDAIPTWSNHDIPNGSATATEIYFKGSEPLTELTKTVTKLVPVERESNYSITSANLNDIAKRTQEMAGTRKLMTPEDIIYWLNRVKFIPHGNAESSFSLSFESSASGSIPVVTKGTATSGFTLTFTSIATGELITEEG